VLPKAVREELRLGAGDTLEIETDGDRITLRPVRPHPALEKEHGIWVYRTGEPLPASVARDALRHAREARDLRNLGVKR
jgi:AbrB family looped-hinge helix DNA binding protein